MELNDLLISCTVKSWSMAKIASGEMLGDSIHNLADCNFSLSKGLYDVAIVGIEEDRNAPSNNGCSLSPQLIRKYLYGLRVNGHSLKIIDLGNLLGEKLKDRYFALEEVLSILSSMALPVIIIGGSQEFSVPAFKGLKTKHQRKNISIVDSVVDVINGSNDFSSKNYLNELCKSAKTTNSQINIIALQRYLFGKSHDDFLLDNNINAIRLGDLKGNGIEFLEPLMRDSDMVSFDVCSISHHDMPAQMNPMPNGISGYDACQLAWYAGMSDRMNVFAVFDLNPTVDKSNNGLLLGAQIIWNFLEGFANRCNDYPLRDIETYTTYHVELNDLEIHVRFFCNPDNDRWWVELPVNGQNEIFSCLKNDYYRVLKNEIPDKWWSYIVENDRNLPRS